MSQYFEAKYILESIPMLLPFLKVTFMVAGLSVLFGTLLGFIIAVAKMGKNEMAKKIAYGYTTTLRCTPSIVLLFLTYYGIPAISNSFGIDLNDVDKIVFVVITFSLQFAAAMSEVIRTAYESIDRGQYEAAVSVGLSPIQAYRRIILPQAFVVALPNFGNSLLALIKEGSLAYTIGLIDVIGKASLIIASNYNAHALETYLALSMIYWVISIAIERLFLLLEKVFSKGKQVLKTA
ncbi:amino acid ABC transporter permease [Paenibacillus validus]|uniref:ABC transporter permease subunit n=1 Tax=Paenibacillus validus TaxID=44253 RepID=A0A7X3CSX6_9BACL|nr:MULTISPECIES: amino acid ABC transporter permease [Paenibacillus]MED4600667.1 amino acid ABC transporter permease [Paenibacillus validus]MED4605306.1 amino acid ABC transporter permease [Paenibacillus validus]MUG71797.1 ABC transporter permease subunit [Paenibacillus validus]